MKHPYRETAELLRELARNELRDKWGDRDKAKALRAEAAELDRLATIDQQEA